MPNPQDSVKFKFGSFDEYNRLTNIDENTWYIITDTGSERIYIGSQLFVDRSTLIWESGTAKYTAVQTVVPNKGTASAIGAVSIGRKNEATGIYSVAQGSNTHATGDYSHSEGQSSTASGIASHAEGFNTDAPNKYMTAVGMLNAAVEQTTLFVVGTGEYTGTSSVRKNGLKVNSDESASSTGMTGSVAVNKFSCNSINTPSFNGTALVLLYIDSGYQLNVDIYLGTDNSGYLLTDNSANGIARYYRSYQILKSKLSFYRTDSSGASIYIYGDGTFVDNLLDGRTVNLTNTSYNLIEISTSQLY